jgi:Rps23 Pro-64 3,4-dihydroxylase Tpa1-like proline 4-hydroxylase
VLGEHGHDHVDHSARRSLVLFDLEGWDDVFRQRLTTFLPQVLARLAMPWFPLSSIEVQLTGTGDGEFFRQHTDNGAGPASSRTLTFVYFFHTEPKAFAGGELRLYETAFEGGRPFTTGAYYSVEPAQNQVVFFPSHYLHEILPVSAPDGLFASRRFTVNGWFHQ